MSVIPGSSPARGNLWSDRFSTVSVPSVDGVGGGWSPDRMLHAGIAAWSRSIFLSSPARIPTFSTGVPVRPRWSHEGAATVFQAACLSWPLRPPT